MFFLFLMAHLVADFLLQPFWLVVRKRRWDGLAIHGALVLLCMLLVSALDARALVLWPAMLAITAVHVAADWWKVHRADRLLRPAIVPFLADQVIHVATLAVALSLALPWDAVWSLHTTAMAPVALLVSAYVIATCAAPIGVMVWLDPSFTHVALAKSARARSFLFGAATVSLALFAGTLALPATLLGFAVAARRPASGHPLDTPAGLIVVLTVAAGVGAALVMLHL